MTDCLFIRVFHHSLWFGQCSNWPFDLVGWRRLLVYHVWLEMTVVPGFVVGLLTLLLSSIPSMITMLVITQLRCLLFFFSIFIVLLRRVVPFRLGPISESARVPPLSFLCYFPFASATSVNFAIRFSVSNWIGWYFFPVPQPWRVNLGAQFQVLESISM